MVQFDTTRIQFPAWLKSTLRTRSFCRCIFLTAQKFQRQVLLFLFQFEATESQDLISTVPLWHEVGLLLFAKLLPGDEFYAFDLLSTVLFNSKFFR